MNNPYALLPLFNAILSIVLITLMLSQPRRDASSRSFIAYTTAIGLWSFIQHLQWAYVSDEWMVTVMKIDSIFWLSVDFLFLKFTYHFLRRRRDLVFYALMACTVLAIVLSLFTDLLITGFRRFPWGPTEVYGPLMEPVGAVVIVLPILYILSLLIQAYRQTRDVMKRRQLLLIMVGSTFSAVFASLTDLVIPVFLGFENMINLGSTAFSVQAVLLFIAIARYRLLDIDVETAAGDLFEHLHEAILIVDRKGKVAAANPAAQSLFGLSRENSAETLAHQLVAGLNAYGYGVDLFETEIGPDSMKKRVSATRLDVQRRGRSVGEVVSLRDVTHIHRANEELRRANAELQAEIKERQRSEALLRGSEERFRTLIEEGSDVVVIFDRQYNYIYASPSVRHVGYEAEQVVGGSITDFVHPEDLPKFTATLEQVAARPDEIIRPQDFRVRRADGSTALFEGALTNKLDHPGIEGIIFNGREITERVRTREALAASQKLADLGTLSAGVAHEINSPLQVITGISDRYLRQLAKDGLQTDLLERDLEVINRNAWRIAKIVRSLLTYSRSKPGANAPQNLNEIVASTLLLTEHQFRSWSNIEITRELAEDLPPLVCDHNSVTQVLINLLTNAAGAMPNGGKITITTRHDSESDTLVLAVRDTGEGIPEENHRRIFDPFFTTKPVGEGTGLGLSISLGMVQALGGEIAVESQVGEGTTMTLRFPLKAETPVSSG